MVLRKLNYLVCFEHDWHGEKKNRIRPLYKICMRNWIPVFIYCVFIPAFLRTFIVLLWYVICTLIFFLISPPYTFLFLGRQERENKIHKIYNIHEVILCSIGFLYDIRQISFLLSLFVMFQDILNIFIMLSFRKTFRC